MLHADQPEKCQEPVAGSVLGSERLCEISKRLARLRETSREPGSFQAEIDEACAGDFGRLAHFAEVEFFDDLLRDLAWIRALLFREDHRDVRLVVAETRVGGGGDFGFGAVEGGAQLCGEQGGDGHGGRYSVFSIQTCCRRTPAGGGLNTEY